MSGKWSENGSFQKTQAPVIIATAPGKACSIHSLWEVDICVPTKSQLSFRVGQFCSWGHIFVLFGPLVMLPTGVSFACGVVVVVVHSPFVQV